MTTYKYNCTASVSAQLKKNGHAALWLPDFSVDILYIGGGKWAVIVDNAVTLCDDTDGPLSVLYRYIDKVFKRVPVYTLDEKNDDWFETGKTIPAHEAYNVDVNIIDAMEVNYM